jgi:hypothetical protein
VAKPRGPTGPLAKEQERMDSLEFIARVVYQELLMAVEAGSVYLS